MRANTRKIFDLVQAINPRPNEWSFLTSIEYMLQSNLYMDSLFEDAQTVHRFLPRQDLVMLDFGTGSGTFSVINRMLSPELTILAVDTVNNTSQSHPGFKDAVEQQQMLYDKLSQSFQIDFKHYDGVNIPYPDQSFDVITAYAVLEHIDPEGLPQIMRELHRILKKDGQLFVFKLPRKWAIMEYITKGVGIGGHDILVGDREAVRLFEGYGFKPIFAQKTDMVFQFPGWFTNKLYYLLRGLDFLLYWTPLRIFAHHNNFVLIKQ